jgi:tellurite resistance protein TehA-like permease
MKRVRCTIPDLRDSTDTAKIWFLPVVALMFIASQFAGLETTSVKHLWIVSTMLGLAYGSLFNVVPMLVLEWFGMGRLAIHTTAKEVC